MLTSHVCLVLLALAAPSIGFTFPGTGSTFARYQNRFQHGVTPTASFQEHDPTNRVEWATTTTTSTTTPSTPTSHGAVNNVRIALLTNMGESTEVKDNGLSLDTKGNDPVYTFSLKSKAPSSLIKEAQSQAIKEASISEAFPGVRMGHVPPHAMPQIRSVALRKAIFRIVQTALDACGLRHYCGHHHHHGNTIDSFHIEEDLMAMAKAYNPGEDIPFTAIFQATGNAAAIPPQGQEITLAEG